LIQEKETYVIEVVLNTKYILRITVSWAICTRQGTAELFLHFSWPF